VSGPRLIAQERVLQPRPGLGGSRIRNYGERSGSDRTIEAGHSQGERCRLDNGGGPNATTFELAVRSAAAGAAAGPALLIVRHRPFGNLPLLERQPSDG